MKKRVPRPYQTEAIDRLRASFAAGNRKVLLCLATGAGKSVIANLIVDMAAKKGTFVLYTVHRILLRDQMRNEMKGKKNVYVDTLQSLKNRHLDEVGLIIADEAHYGSNSRLQSDILSKYDVPVIGLTATPIKPDGSKLDGWDDVIDVVQLVDLVELGFASRVRVLAPASVDRSGFRVQNGEYNAKDVGNEVTKRFVVQNVVEKFLKYHNGGGAVLYCINIKHAEIIRDELIVNGVSAAVYHSKMKKEELASVMNGFLNGDIDVIANVEMLVVGFDTPRVYTLCLSCPTKSYIKAIQAFGRGTRLDDSLDRLLLSLEQIAMKKICFIAKLDKDVNTIKQQLKDKGLEYILVISPNDTPPDGHRVVCNVFPNNPNKECLILDMAGVIDDTIHPLDRMNFDKERKKRKLECKKCGGDVYILKRTVDVSDDGLISTVTTVTKCKKCWHEATDTEDKLIEHSYCLECNSVIQDATTETVIDEKTNTVTISVVCPECGAKKPFKKVELIDVELEEKKLNERNWGWVHKQIKSATNKDGKKYHHKWASRVIDGIESAGYDIDTVVKFIETYNKNNWRIGGILTVLSKWN